MLILMVGEMLAMFPSSKVSGAKNGIFEPIDFPMNEIFGFHKKLIRLRHKFFGEEERVMVHVVPWVLRGG